jgi:hypothetical protein
MQATHAYRTMNGQMSSLAGRCRQLDQVLAGFAFQAAASRDAALHQVSLERKHGTPTIEAQHAKLSSLECDQEVENYWALLQTCSRSARPGQCLQQDQRRTERKLATISRSTQTHALAVKRLNILNVLLCPLEKVPALLSEWGEAEEAGLGPMSGTSSDVPTSTREDEL